MISSMFMLTESALIHIFTQAHGVQLIIYGTIAYIFTHPYYVDIILCICVQQVLP